MKIIFLLLGLVSLSVAIPMSFSEEHNRFRNWMLEYNKLYKNEEEFIHRFQIFKQNLEKVAQLNKDSVNSDVKYGVTQFMDLSAEEFEALYLTTKPPSLDQIEVDASLSSMVAQLPSSFDWRESNCITPVKHQAQCGACYAFATTEATETAYCIQTGKLLVLAPQQLVSCTGAGCSGGEIEKTLDYIKEHGLVEESEYPYTSGEKGEIPPCHMNSKPVAWVSGYAAPSVDHLNETAMQIALQRDSPLVAVIGAGDTLQFYKSGILQDCPMEPNHAVQVVGYSTEDPAAPYWIVRNSWGDQWGENGYFRIPMFKNACNVAKYSLYVYYNA